MQGNFSDVMTIYNRVMQGGSELWQRTVIRGVELADCRGEAMRHSGAASSSARRVGPVSVSEMTVIIPKRAHGGYLTPMGWRMAENRVGCWTLQAGDVIVPALCATEMRESMEELLEVSDRVAVIGTAVDFGGEGEMSHWEVSAR